MWSSETQIFKHIETMELYTAITGTNWISALLKMDIHIIACYYPYLATAARKRRYKESKNHYYKHQMYNNNKLCKFNNFGMDWKRRFKAFKRLSTCWIWSIWWTAKIKSNTNTKYAKYRYTRSNETSVDSERSLVFQLLAVLLFLDVFAWLLCFFIDILARNEYQKCFYLVSNQYFLCGFFQTKVSSVS